MKLESFAWITDLSYKVTMLRMAYIFFFCSFDESMFILAIWLTLIKLRNCRPIFISTPSSMAVSILDLQKLSIEIEFGLIMDIIVVIHMAQRMAQRMAQSTGDCYRKWSNCAIEVDENWYVLFWFITLKSENYCSRHTYTRLDAAGNANNEWGCVLGCESAKKKQNHHALTWWKVWCKLTPVRPRQLNHYFWTIQSGRQIQK